MGVPKVRLEKSWNVRQPRDGLATAIGDTIFQYRMQPAQDLPAPTVDQRSRTTEIWGGSQRTMWLLGALFVNQNTLPHTGQIVRTRRSVDEPTERITLRLEDNIGFGLMDPLTARRFKRLFKRIAATLEDGMRANSAGIEDAPWGR